MKSEPTQCPKDTELNAFLARTLTAAEAAKLEAHLADCDDCRKLVFALASSSISPADDAGPAIEKIGKFDVLEEIGRGAMGVVYKARDPELDRVVAIKLRRATSRLEVDAEDRVRREAQALARLTHPNVVAIYEAGRHERSTFLAMEYVDGAPLDEWLRGERPQAEIVDRLIEAGRGLAAAHGVGLVHRDFKPRNVLVAAAGTAKVGDFGLVRTRDDAAETAGAPPRGFALTLTLSGAMLGTPAYMSPEQLRGETATEASDQFSFCVTLYEALYAKRPFVGATIAQLLGGMTKPLALPAAPRVRPGIARVLLRGLALDPSNRFPSMTALLAALDQRRGRRRGMLFGAVAASVLALGGVTFAAMSKEEKPAVCRGAERNLAGIWDDARKQQVRIAFQSSGVPYATDAWQRVERIVDGFATRWATAHRGACEATRVHGEQTEQVLSARMWCLDDRLREAKALTDVLAAGGKSTVARAIDAASKLPSVELCADGRALTEKQPPKDAAARGRIDALSAELAQAKTTAEFGKLGDGVKRLADLAARVEQEGYAPLQAEVLLELSRMKFMLEADPEAAEEMLTKAVLAAEAGRHDVIRARASIVLIFIVGIAQARHAEGHKYAEHAAAVIKRLVGGDGLEGQRLGNQGQLYAVQGKFDEAQKLLEQGLEKLERSSGKEHVETGRMLAQLADMARQRGELDKAIELARRAHAIHENGYGPGHPEAAKSLFGVGIAQEDAGRLDEAAPTLTKTIEILEAALGKDHIDLASATDELGIVLRKQGKLEEAERAHARALELRLKVRGPEHPETGISYDNMAIVLSMRGQHAKALEYSTHGVAITEAAFGPEHPDTAASHGGRGHLAIAAERWEDAIAAYHRAIEIGEKAVGPDHADLSFYLAGLGQAQLGAKRPREAAVSLERALKIRNTTELDPGATAEVKLFLARALWDAKQDRKRAVQLAEEARAAYKALDKTDVEDWLATHKL